MAGGTYCPFDDLPVLSLKIYKRLTVWKAYYRCVKLVPKEPVRPANGQWFNNIKAVDWCVARKINSGLAGVSS